MNYRTVLQHNLPIRQLRQLFIVRNDEEGLFEGVAEDEEKVVEFAGVLGVEVAGGLVGEDQLGVVHQGTGHRNTLLLPSRQLRGFVPYPISKFQKIKKFLRSFESFLTTFSGDERGHRHILQRRELGQQMVELIDETDMPVSELRQLVVGQTVEIHAVNDHLSPIRLVQRADDMQQRRFTGPGRTDNRHDFAVLYRQGDLFQDLQTAVGFLDFFDLDHQYTFYTQL